MLTAAQVRVRSDNRIANLRDVSHAENQQNREVPSSQPATGVRTKRGRFYAYALGNRRQVHLGAFATLASAIAARAAFLDLKSAS